jgi:hypothetical protein
MAKSVFEGAKPYDIRSRYSEWVARKSRTKEQRAATLSPRARGFERASNQPGSKAVPARLRRDFRVGECDQVVREPVVRHCQHAVVIHFEPGELGIIVQGRRHAGLRIARLM